MARWPKNADDPARSVLDLLDAHTVMSLATVSDGRPHAVSLMYANDGYTLYWLSDPRSRHSVALRQSAESTVTVSRQFADFREIIGVQATGTAHEIADDAEAKAGLRMLAERYEFLEQFTSGPRSLVRRLDLAAVYRFDPVEVTLIDNSKGFGHKETFRPIWTKR